MNDSLNIHTIAAEIARRIPEMVKDSPINNADCIANLLKPFDDEVLLHSFLRHDLAVIVGSSLPERNRLGNNSLVNKVYQIIHGTERPAIQSANKTGESQWRSHD